MRTPSFGNLMVLGPMVENRLHADSISSLGSMDFVLGDTDAMKFSPQLEQRIAGMVQNYPPGRLKGAVIPMLMYCQDEVGYISKELAEEVASRCGDVDARVEEVVGFYTMLRKQKMGKTHLQICTNISCLLMAGKSCDEHACKSSASATNEVTPTARFRSKKWNAPAPAPGRPASKLITTSTTT
jgi:NADH-quinone oxidoreductase subunit E